MIILGRSFAHRKDIKWKKIMKWRHIHFCLASLSRCSSKIAPSQWADWVHAQILSPDNVDATFLHGILPYLLENSNVPWSPQIGDLLVSLLARIKFCFVKMWERNFRRLLFIHLLRLIYSVLSSEKRRLLIQNSCLTDVYADMWVLCCHTWLDFVS